MRGGSAPLLGDQTINQQPTAVSPGSYRDFRDLLGIIYSTLFAALDDGENKTSFSTEVQGILKSRMLLLPTGSDKKLSDMTRDEKQSLLDELLRFVKLDFLEIMTAAQDIYGYQTDQIKTIAKSALKVIAHIQHFANLLAGSSTEAIENELRYIYFLVIALGGSTREQSQDVIIPMSQPDLIRSVEAARAQAARAQAARAQAPQSSNIWVLEPGNSIDLQYLDPQALQCFFEAGHDILKLDLNLATNAVDSAVHLLSHAFAASSGGGGGGGGGDACAPIVGCFATVGAAIAKVGSAAAVGCKYGAKAGLVDFMNIGRALDSLVGLTQETSWMPLAACSPICLTVQLWDDCCSEDIRGYCCTGVCFTVAAVGQVALNASATHATFKACATAVCARKVLGLYRDVKHDRRVDCSMPCILDAQQLIDLRGFVRKKVTINYSYLADLLLERAVDKVCSNLVQEFVIRFNEHDFKCGKFVWNVCCTKQYNRSAAAACCSDYPGNIFNINRSESIEVHIQSVMRALSHVDGQSTVMAQPISLG